MNIFSAKQLKQADQETIKKQNISSVELMERAASRAYHKIKTDIADTKKNFAVFCGIGNNGGDGLVIARKLLEEDKNVQVFIVAYSESRSDEFKENLKLVGKIPAAKISVLNKNSGLPDFKDVAVVIDAIFGIGLNRTMPEWVNKLVDHINKTNIYTIAVDMPSGLFSNRIPKEENTVLKADKTLTFQTPKLVFYLPQTAKYTGQVEIIDIGLDKTFLDKLKPEARLILKEDLKRIKKPRTDFSHKGTYGHNLIIGGSYGKIGSMVLATQAGLRVGAGKVTALVPKCGYSILQSTVPEAMVLTSEGHEYLNVYKTPDFEPEVICFGMGAGTEQQTADFFMDVMKTSKNKPMLIDADGLNLLSEYDILLEFIPENSVLTPHPKELERLIGDWEDDFDKLEKARAFARKNKVVLVLKDAITFIVDSENTFVNTTGNSGMATAGSGDVLSGVISGLMAQGYSSLEAAKLGVYIHGKAGDLFVKDSAPEALIAGDLIHKFGVVFRYL